MMHFHMHSVLVSAAFDWGLAGTSSSPGSKCSFHLSIPMCILCKIRSLNGSHIPPTIPIPTTDTRQRTDHHEWKGASVVLFLRWIFGKWADSLEYAWSYEVQLPSHKPFSFSWSAPLILLWYRGFSTAASWCLWFFTTQVLEWVLVLPLLQPALAAVRGRQRLPGREAEGGFASLCEPSMVLCMKRCNEYHCSEADRARNDAAIL